jgi:signal peptidase I
MTDTAEKPHTNTQSTQKKQGLSDLSFIFIFLPALILAVWCLTVFVFQAYQVDGPSMQTTLFNSNRLIVWKLPRTWARVTGHQYVPKRGDIVVFSADMLASYGQGPNKQLIKRVIGLPGDHLVIKSGVVTIYNKQHPNGFDPDKTLSYGRVIGITSGNIDITIPKNEVFVMGDNRSDSLDSRIFGPIPTSTIVGQLVLKMLPASQIKAF